MQTDFCTFAFLFNHIKTTCGKEILCFFCAAIFFNRVVPTNHKYNKLIYTYIIPFTKPL